MILRDEPPQAVARADAAGLGDAVADVGAVETGDEFFGVFERQFADDLGARAFIGGGGERDARHAREALGEDAELAILGAEVVAPLRDAVRLVDREQRDIDRRQQLQQARLHDPLRRDVEEIERAGAHRLSRSRSARATTATNSRNAALMPSAHSAST